MRLLDLTLPTPAENLALDEALLDEAEAAGRPAETLRFWEPAEAMVVVGRSSKPAEEVRLAACRELGISVLRRPSGGAAVVAGPGCLMYALVLSLERRPGLRVADRAHRAVLGVMVEALRPLLRKAPLDTATAPLASCRDREGRLSEVACQGTSDLALAGRKFSGNSVRMKREHLLYHGTLLHDFPLDLIERCLAMPPRQPEYRRQRPHREFVVNLPLPAADVRKALAAAWGATEPCFDWPRRRTAELVAGRYGRREWNEAGA